MVKRAWAAHVADGAAKDRFANAVAARVSNEVEPPQGGAAELVENWLALADAMFDSGADAESVELEPLYELTMDDDAENPTYYTDAQIAEAVELYAAFYDIETGAVDVNRNCEGGTQNVIGFRLSRDTDGAQRGDDETHGEF